MVNSLEDVSCPNIVFQAMLFKPLLNNRVSSTLKAEGLLWLLNLCVVMLNDISYSVMGPGQGSSLIYGAGC